MAKQLFIHPTFKGTRFDDHQLPIDVLAEFKSYSDLVLALAKHLYLDTNKSRQKVPKGFAKQLELKISKLESGSVAVQLERSYEDDQDYPEFAQARDIIDRVIANGTADSLPSEFPASFLNYFEQFGRTLRDDESIEFAMPGKVGPATVYNRERRMQLINPTRRSKTGAVLLTGRITVLDANNRKFGINLDDENVVGGVYSKEVSEQLRDAHRHFETREVIMLAKALTFSDKTIHHLDSIQHIIIYKDGEILFSLPELSKKAEDIKALKQGWLDGEGTPFETKFVDAVISALKIIQVEKKIPFPYLYPTPEGSIQAEWSFGTWEVSLNFLSDSAILHAANMANEEIIENKFGSWSTKDGAVSIAEYLVEKFVEVIS